MNKAIIVRIDGIEKHPNADNLMLAKVLGCQVIVGKNQLVGDTVVFYPTELAISVENCMANSLYRKHPETGERNDKGYLDHNGRIKTLKLRGSNSEGLVLPLSSLDWAGKNKLKVGDEFDTINKHKICEKYINRATRALMNRAARKYRKPAWLPRFLVKYHKKYVVDRVGFDSTPDFQKHTTTGKLRLNLHNIPQDHVSIQTLKRHGTSGRTIRTKHRSKNWLKRLFRSKGKYCYVSGTRNVVKPINFYKGKDDGYYGGTDFRGEIHKQIMDIGLKHDEAIYYEITGFAAENTKIMPDHVIKKSDFKEAGFRSKEIDELIEQYDGVLSYLYGCEQGEWAIHIYRITQNNVDLSWKQLVTRCEELGLNPVEYLSTVSTNDDLSAEFVMLEKKYERQDQLQEGVCFRIETPEGKLVKTYKAKFFIFCVAEGIRSNFEIDLETIS